MPLISDSIGRVLGKRYRLVSALGAGASAHVFLAEDVSLQRHVAVKVLQPGLAQDEAFLKRFRAEARSVASLNHPHVLRVFDWGEDTDGPYLVLEYLGGGSLRDLLDQGSRLSQAQAARLGVEAAQGLAYAHARGLVHRDIKPANVLFDEEGRVRIADFGVARALAQASWTEPVGAIIGTARYTSPEQAQGRALDGRADVYSLALVLYEAVTGVIPFVADTTVGTLMARVGQPLPSHRLLGPLDGVLARAAAPDADARLDASQLAARLGAVGAGLAAPAPLPLRPARTQADPAASVTGIAPHVVFGDHTVVGMVDRDAPGSQRPGDDDHGGAALVAGGVAGGVTGAAVAGVSAARAGPGEIFDYEALVGSGEARTPGHPGGGTATSPGGVAAAGLDAKPRGTPEAAAPGGSPDPGTPSGPPPVVHRRRRHRWRWVVAGGLAAALVAAALLTAWQEQVFTPSDPVPSLVGLSTTQAHAALVRGHFKLHVGPAVQSITMGPGLIVRQDPPAHTSLDQGGTVAVVLSKGPPAVAVPSLAGVDCGVAARLLDQVHLKAACPALTA
jgi:serine/threonine-protein kinase